MRNIFALPLLVFFLSCKSSLTENKPMSYIDYYQHVYKADSLAIVGKYNKSYKILDSLFKIYVPINDDIYNEYQTYLKVAHLSGNKKNLRNKMIRGITNYGLDKNWFKNDTTNTLNKIYKFSKISNNDYQNYRKTYLSNIDINLRSQVIKMTQIDQYFRTQYDRDDYRKKMDSVDTLNEKVLIDLFEEGIYPNLNVIGNSSVDESHNIYIETMLLHTKDSIRNNYFLPKIKEFIEQGKCSPQIYGRMVDQYQLYNDKEQIYGTYNQNEIPIKDYVKFNSKRKKIGLSNLEYRIWRVNRILSINYL